MKLCPVITTIVVLLAILCAIYGVAPVVKAAAILVAVFVAGLWVEKRGDRGTP